MLISKLRRSHFLRSAAVLGTGTVVAQMILLMASPALTRLYDPKAFGIVAVFMAVVNSFRASICGKYEVAVVVVRTRRNSERMLGLALYTAFFVSMLLLVAFIVLKEQVLHLFNVSALGGWLYFAPAVLVFSGISLALSYFANREGNYSVIAYSKVIGAAIAVAGSVSLGLFDVPSGFLIGTISGPVATALALIILLRNRLGRDVLAWTKKKALLAKKYYDYPLFNASTSLLDGVTVAMPVFFLSMYYSDTLVGYYALLLRVGQTPLTFIANTVSQINLRKVVDLLGQGQSVRVYLFKLTGILIAIVSPFALIIILFSEQIFSVVFGGDWVEAGSLLAILMPALALRFVVSTLSSTLGATGNNGLGALWKILAFLSTLFMFVLLAPWLGAHQIFYAMLGLDVVIYLVYYSCIWYAAAHPRLKSV